MQKALIVVHFLPTLLIDANAFELSGVLRIGIVSLFPCQEKKQPGVGHPSCLSSQAISIISSCSQRL
jgi:hypothetical protein